jgi:hypothetical protein
LPSLYRTAKQDQDPGIPLNPDPTRIRIHNTGMYVTNLVLGNLIGDGSLLLFRIHERIAAVVVRVLHLLLFLPLLLLSLAARLPCLLDGVVELHRHALVPGESVQVGGVQLALLVLAGSGCHGRGNLPSSSCMINGSVLRDRNAIHFVK